MAIEESASYKLESGNFDIDQYRPVPVTYELRASILKKLCTKEDPLPDLQGREEAKRDVLRALLSGHNIFLVSEEGTGKTRLAQSITKLLPSIHRIKGCLYNDDLKCRHICSAHDAKMNGPPKRIHS
ncbi:MAG: ATP-binding protein [Thermodesulfobacteriota bacterium]|nr:ATP-binding protein [Thermodesulfobacteriota bacterium]